MKFKYITLFCFLAASINAAPVDFNKSQLNLNDLNRISDAIYRIEGGNKTKFPFGIKSINTRGDYQTAKRICENTINNNFIRWNHNKSIDFLTFLASVYCPKSCDPIGNKNWVKNIHLILK